MTIIREDGSKANSNITIADTAPGFLTGESCRGPALGSTSTKTPHGQVSTTPISACSGGHCRTIPIAIGGQLPTKVQLLASGFRNATSKSDIKVTIAGIPIPVLSYGAAKEPGVDFLVIEVPQSLRGIGETDLMSHVNGRPSNAVRINLGEGKPSL
jgi:uncharacterized protein (TIGR03437 family)